MTLVLEEIAIGDIKPSLHNARTHDAKQIRQIAASIQSFGFTNPVLIDQNNDLIAGHGRYEAAKLLSLARLPAIRVTHLSDTQKRALMLADNKIALNAGWNVDVLSAELADLSSIELDFDVSLTGFEVPEIDLLLGEGASDGEMEETAPLPDSSLPPVAQKGDLWILGRHRVVCGDALDAACHERLMDGRLADMGFTDPPYNVPIDGHVSGSGKIKHREFAQACGEMSSEVFEAFLARSLDLGARHSRDGSVWFACIDWRHIGEMQNAGTQVFDAWLNMCVWAKTNGGMGSLYRSQHELVFVFRKGRASHRNNVELGRHGRNRTNLWTYAGVNTFRAGRVEELQAHPTAKPVSMIRDAILDVTARGEVVLGPFLGAGATLIAAERCGRCAYGIEIDPLYVDTVLRRWRVETGEEPMRKDDDRTLSSIEEERGDDLDEDPVVKTAFLRGAGQ